jgi:hypothetical protein
MARTTRRKRQTQPRLTAADGHREDERREYILYSKYTTMDVNKQTNN